MDRRMTAGFFGAAFIFLGILGFLPSVMFGGKVLGLFAADTTLSIIYLLSGAALLFAYFAEGKYPKQILEFFGLMFGAFAVLGFVFGGDVIVTRVSVADNVLHLVIAAAALYFGFHESKAKTKKKKTTRRRKRK